MSRSRRLNDRQPPAAPSAPSRSRRRFIVQTSIGVAALILGGAGLLIPHLPVSVLTDWRTVSVGQALTAGLVILTVAAALVLLIRFGQLIARRAHWGLNRPTPDPAPPAARTASKRNTARPPRFYAWLSVATALATMALKSAAYLLTDSVALFSDAAESLVNLTGAGTAVLVLHYAARPADTAHPFGHGKAEYFSSGFEGALILVAAVGISWAAAERLLLPQPVAALDLGAAVAVLAALLNLIMARTLLAAGRASGSIALEADGRHLMTDVWTTAAVLSGLAGMWFTGWTWLDAAIAILAALHILGTGVRLIGRSLSGLLGAAIPGEEREIIEGILADYRHQGIQFHDLRSRMSGIDRFLTLHVLVPGRMSVKDGHDLLERLEHALCEAIPGLHVVTHLEPIEDPSSFRHEMIS